MLSPKLEELIWCGKATFKTWTIGTGAANLSVGRNKIIIVVGFDYFPFIDAGNAADVTVDLRPRWWERMNKQVTFSSRARRYNFLMRNYFVQDQGVQSGMFKVDCYLPFVDNITLTIANFPPVSGWAIANAQAPKESESPRPPLSVGNEANGGLLTPVRVNIGNLGGSELRPFPQEEPAVASSYENWQVPFATDTQQLAPNASVNNVGNQQYPFLNVYYVEVNERGDAKFI